MKSQLPSHPDRKVSFHCTKRQQNPGQQEVWRGMLPFQTFHYVNEEPASQTEKGKNPTKPKSPEPLGRSFPFMIPSPTDSMKEPPGSVPGVTVGRVVSGST